jgi:hypothetical protein
LKISHQTEFYLLHFHASNAIFFRKAFRKIIRAENQAGLLGTSIFALVSANYFVTRWAGSHLSQGHCFLNPGPFI